MNFLIERVWHVRKPGDSVFNQNIISKRGKGYSETRTPNSPLDQDGATINLRKKTKSDLLEILKNRFPNEGKIANLASDSN